MAKSKYDPETFPTLVEGYAREGYADKDIAVNLGIHPSTFCDYVNKYPEFAEARARGRKPVLVELENTMAGLSRGGLEVEETHTEVLYDKEGNEVGRKVKTIKRKLPPNADMSKFLACNWMKDKYSLSQKHEISGDVAVNFDSEDKGL